MLTLFVAPSTVKMDRAQELRSLMKGGAKKEEQGPMSGKDKAKLLKMMKEQSKQKEQVRPAAASKPRAAAPPTQASAQSGLPSDFFDAAQSAPAAAPAVVARPPQSNAQSSSTKTVSSNISNLPKGFFDNPVEDLNARGISMEQYTAKMEKDEQAELDSFLTQLKGIEGESERLEEAADQRDESTREYEEEAAQMAYLANLIALRAQSEKLTKASAAASNNTDTLQEEGSDALDHLLKEVAEVRAATTNTSSAALDVDAILSQKLAQNAAQKRKRDAILKNIHSNRTTSKIEENGGKDSGDDSSSDSGSDDESDGESNSNKKAKPVPKYTPLNFMNWTSRTY